MSSETDTTNHSISRRHAVELALGAAAVVAFGTPRQAYAAGKKFPIVYVLNGGNNPSSQVTQVSQGKSLLVSKLKKPTREGYVFKGWYSNKALSKSAQKVYGIKSVSKRRLYARWTKEWYAISYKTKGGTLPKSAPLTYSIATHTFDLPTPSRPGYEFLGWFAEKELLTQVTCLEKGSTGKKTFYAKWEKIIYTISYVLNGGVQADEQRTVFTTASNDIKLLAPTRKGYAFEGWYTGPEFGERVYKIKNGSVGSITLYAKWGMKDYWKEYMAQRLPELQALDTEIADHGDSFVFISDVHVKSNALKSPAAIQYICENTAADKVVFTGDLLNRHDTKELALEYAEMWTSRMNFADVYTARGNHDSNNQGASSVLAAKLTDSEVCVMLKIDLLDENRDVADHVPQEFELITEEDPYDYSQVGELVDPSDPENPNDPDDPDDPDDEEGESGSEDEESLEAKILALSSLYENGEAGEDDGIDEQETAFDLYNAEADEGSEGADAQDGDEESEEEEGDTTEPLCYCIDIEKSKIRYIFLDTGAPLPGTLRKRQLAWMQQRILELKEGWSVAVFQHIFFDRSIEDLGMKVLHAIDAIYDEAEASIIGVFSGHTHRDMSYMAPKGYICACVTTDAFKKSREYKYASEKSLRVSGEYTEQAFDVVHIDTANHKVSMTRIGYGKDRVFTYK